MSHQSDMPDPHTRQACEPCRRKKTKCTAERPQCSFCTRLGVQCVYMPRGRARRAAVSKTARTTALHHFRRIENQMSDLYDLLRTSSNQEAAEAHDAAASTLHTIAEPLQTHPHESSTTWSQTSPHPDVAVFSPTRPTPPIEILEHFVDVYRRKIHLQPLPLFSLEGLPGTLSSGPQYLLWSFLSLMLTMTTNSFYRNNELDAREFYANSAEEVVKKLSFEGVASPDTTQSLCLLALKHIKARQAARAWMAIGAASRLDTLSRLCLRDSAKDDRACRAYWSIFLLERFYLPQTGHTACTETLGYPESAPLPPPPESTSASRKDRYTLYSEACMEVSTNDMGINEYSLCLATVWGKVRTYLYRLRQGHLEKPWLSESTYTKLGIELYECEAQLTKQHLLINVAPSSRTKAEIEEQREYWHPWISMQINSHAMQAILNHPFLHLVVLRSQGGMPPSRLFLQQAVDQALYHSGWVCRLIRTCRSMLEIIDPLLGDVIAATVTVPWLFQFAKDPKVATRAQSDISVCLDVLSNMALTWPHISDKLDVLRKLQSLADETRRAGTASESTINFKSRWIWDLLSPVMPLNIHANSKNLDQLSGNGGDPDARMHLTTRFVHPLHEDHDQEEELPEPLPLYTDPLDPFFSSPGDVEQFHIEELSSEFLHYGLWDEYS